MFFIDLGRDIDDSGAVEFVSMADNNPFRITFPALVGKRCSLIGCCGEYGHWPSRHRSRRQARHADPVESAIYSAVQCRATTSNMVQQSDICSICSYIFLENRRRS
jgi:hypothetical protein